MITGSITMVAPQPAPRGSAYAKTGADCSKRPATHAPANKCLVAVMVPAFEFAIYCGTPRPELRKQRGTNVAVRTPQFSRGSFRDAGQRPCHPLVPHVRSNADFLSSARQAPA